MRSLTTFITSLLMLSTVVFSTGQHDGKQTDSQPSDVDTTKGFSSYDATDFYDYKFEQNRRRLQFGTYSVVSILCPESRASIVNVLSNY